MEMAGICGGLMLMVVGLIIYSFAMRNKCAYLYESNKRLTSRLDTLLRKGDNDERNKEDQRETVHGVSVGQGKGDAPVEEETAQGQSTDEVGGT